MSDPLDVSGEWSGVFSYPRDLAPVSFLATLREVGGWITGTMEETSDKAFGPPRPLSALIQGRRVGAAVSWLKLYDESSAAHDAVAYEGEISAEGEEIGGRWSIPGSWSGTFLMLRKPKTGAQATRSARARH